MLSLEIRQVLNFVIRRLANNDHDITHELDQIFAQGNQNALRNLEDLAEQKQMDDVLRIIRESLQGNFARLRELERNFKDDLYRFYDDPNPASNDWPSWCYNFTKKNNPVRQDVSGTTDSGNVFAIESSGNEMYRAIQGQCHDLVSPHRPVPRRNPQNENRDQGSVIPQRDHSELFQSIYENGLSRSTGSTSEQPDFPQPSGPLRHPLPEELAPLPHCYTCGRNIQDIQTSDRIWSKISDMIDQLSVVQQKGFITAINDYDPNILCSIRFHVFTFSETFNAFIVTRLKLFNINGNTRCILCLLNNTFQCIGRSDLADEVRHIRSRMR